MREKESFSPVSIIDQSSLGFHSPSGEICISPWSVQGFRAEIFCDREIIFCIANWVLARAHLVERGTHPVTIKYLRAAYICVALCFVLEALCAASYCCACIAGGSAALLTMRKLLLIYAHTTAREFSIMSADIHNKPLRVLFYFSKFHNSCK